MQSQLTVRLSDDLERGLSVLAKRLHLKRSDIVRMALERFLEEMQGKEEGMPYEKVKSLLGIISTGITDLGEEHRKYLLKQFKRNA
ncbi:MAG: ribbon-helix-helix protein, CopG family [Nitrospirota bacterium]|jgi:metal-responsive CopG/Arc/MetJ family transcriptional regulator